MEPSAVALRWYTRSIERRYDDDVSSWTPSTEDSGFRFSVGALYTIAPESDSLHSAGTPTVSQRIVVLIDEPRMSVKLDCSARFSFEDDLDMTVEDAAAFATGVGAHYSIGFVRGALADLTRSVGLPAIMLPASLPDEVLNDIRDSILSSNE